MSAAAATGNPGATWPERRISGWAELQAILESLAGECVFRGQGSHEWSLLPSFNRVVPCADELLALHWEFRAILRFRSEAHAYIPPSVMPPDHFKLEALDTYVEWLMLMQHYGAPTRLLDWTHSPYVAIYFAAIDRVAEDGAIWYFAPGPAEAALCTRYGRSPGSFVDYADLRAEEICRPGDPCLLYTAIKKFRSAREVAQQGVFTFTNRLNAVHQDVIAERCGAAPFGRLVIPRELKTDVCRRLSLMNVTAAALFPGIEGVCESIRDSLRLAVAGMEAQQAAPAVRP